MLQSAILFELFLVNLWEFKRNVCFKRRILIELGLFCFLGKWRVESSRTIWNWTWWICWISRCRSWIRESGSCGSSTSARTSPACKRPSVKSASRRPWSIKRCAASSTVCSGPTTAAASTWWSGSGRGWESAASTANWPTPFWNQSLLFSDLKATICIQKASDE